LPIRSAAATPNDARSAMRSCIGGVRGCAVLCSVGSCRGPVGKEPRTPPGRGFACRRAAHAAAESRKHSMQHAENTVRSERVHDGVNVMTTSTSTQSTEAREHGELLFAAVFGSMAHGCSAAVVLMQGLLTTRTQQPLAGSWLPGALTGIPHRREPLLVPVRFPVHVQY
jgi:hypothetical protein